ncbi:MAG: hypothetical protein A2172_04250 [Candidatus Woykebacteria bacterium RBG_13_40_15]|uniref:Four helix bundle protein n=1 Tax=Candidatus Woykebacteria bacterium RBG_13_40_15 TaxID=1802593 RepID=A0A1G1W6U9_9BACT|nr:MAG: hypothetical protein A2172_04250 [Candidatus Woykebacteria bacterium RBG_13_40_15]
MVENKGYKKLKVWQEAHEFVLMIYEFTKRFPKEEVFSLTNQLRRAAVSVAANIVEGQVKNSRKSFIQALNIANGSLVEAEYYLELARELKFLDTKGFDKLDRQRVIVGNLLNGLIKSLKDRCEA